MSDPRFCIIPARALEVEELTGMDIKLLCYFGKHADKNGWWRLSQVQIAKYFKKARSTIQSSVARLIDAGLLEKHAVITKSGRDSAHYWRVVFDFGMPEKGTPPDVLKSRAILADDGGDLSGQDEAHNHGDTPADISAPPAGEPAPPAASGAAPPAASGAAPSITEHLNGTPSPDARAREGGGDDEKDLKKEEGRLLTPNERKRLLEGWHEFEGRFNGSEKNLMMKAAKLAPDELERATCLERIKIYKRLTANDGFKCHYSTYIKERKFDTAPIVDAMQKAEAEQEAREAHQKIREAQVRLNPFGKPWMALRLQKLQAGEPLGDIDAIDGRWLNRDEVPDFEHFVQVHRESDEWKKWAQWHVANKYSFPKNLNEWIWVPTAEAPAVEVETSWERKPFSGEFVAGWFQVCRKLGGGIVRKGYDACVRSKTPMKLTWPVLAERDCVTVNGEDEDFKVLQDGLDALGVLRLPDPMGDDYQVPTRIWTQVKVAASETPEGDEEVNDYECL